MEMCTRTIQGVSNGLPHTTYYRLPLGTPWMVQVYRWDPTSLSAVRSYLNKFWKRHRERDMHWERDMLYVELHANRHGQLLPVHPPEICLSTISRGGSVKINPSLYFLNLPLGHHTARVLSLAIGKLETARTSDACQPSCHIVFVEKPPQ